MPRGNFIPFEPTERFFGRLQAFEMECPRCGKILVVGRGKPHDHLYNRVTSEMQCPKMNPRDETTAVTRHPGCGMKFLIGIVAWPIRVGYQHKARPPDHVPDDRQLHTIRAYARGLWPKTKKAKGDSLNQIEPEIDLPSEEET